MAEPVLLPLPIPVQNRFVIFLKVQGGEVTIFIPYSAHSWNSKTSETKDRPDDACLTAVDPGPFPRRNAGRDSLFCLVSLDLMGTNILDGKRLR